MLLYLLSLSLFFFFLKQKTAYELRISDWSSDVCSSDLERPLAPENFPHDRDVFFRTGDRLAETVTVPAFGNLRPRWPHAHQEAVVGQRLQRHRRHREIGRASCRERECQ